jgi:CDP-diacylglycerol--glycerol-3-phosphate 3-phosphatidyltransferase
MMSRPNQLTILRMAITPAFVVTLLSESMFYKYLSVALFVAASLTDWYDGYMARKSGNTTVWGKFLDPLADKVLTISALVAFGLLGKIAWWMVWVIALRDLLITGLRSYSMLKGTPMVTSNLAKWKTALQMAAIYLVLVYILVERGANNSAVVRFAESYAIVYNLMFFITLFSAVTGVHYLYDNRGYLKTIALAFYRAVVPTNIR